MQTLLSKKDRFFVISATIIGGIIEWYEIFLFIHWADLFSKLFFQENGKLAILNSLFIFFFGFLGRPVGATLFGNIGDRFGRKSAFIGSIALMVGPSILIGLMLPGLSGISVAIFLCVLRFVQGMAAGAELPGAMCYLVECAPREERAYICSFSFLGPQIGILISQLECYFFDRNFSPEFIETFGWRISFMIGGVFAFLAIFYRRKLEESRGYKILKEKNLTSRRPLIETISNHWRELILGFFASLLAVVGFYMFSVFLEIYFNNVLKISKSDNLLISIGMMALSTATLTLLGRLGNVFKIKSLLTWSALGIMILSLPFYVSAKMSSVLFTTILELMILFCLNMQFAILPSFIAELFPTVIRYSGIALSFSLCDSIVGGITPWLAGLLTDQMGAVLTFQIFISIAALVSFAMFLLVKEKRLKMRNV